MVWLKLPAPIRPLPIIAGLIPTATTHPLPDVARKGVLALRSLGEIRKLASEHDAVVLGPGLGQHHETRELVRRFISKNDKPIIIDADGLNALAGDLESLKNNKAVPVLTPHPGEFKRLSEKDVPTDIHEKIVTATEFANEYGVVLVLKGSPTLVASPDGNCWLNPTGNDGMATGGSGDVLSGIIGTLLAQGLAPVEAAKVAVYVHGLAGDLAAEELTPRCMIASDIMDSLPEAFEYLDPEI